MFNIAIIEDDKNFSAMLNESILKFGAEKNLSFNISVFESIENFLIPRQDSFDIVFFDIELPGMNGMDGAKKFRSMDTDAVIIFITSLSKYAVNGYEVDAMDYMVKPITYNNFSLKLEKAIRKTESRQYKTIYIHAKDGVRKVRSIDVYFLEVRGHNLTVHTDNGSVDASGSLSEFEEELRPYNFSRCNSCYLVNMRAIVRIDGMSIWLRNGEELAISRRKKKEFLDDFTQYIGNNR
ncbi:MAG: response regulator transcription factor [Eubacterium sp.]|nr:response regulator transcription factor [Eubacterium sp.]